MCACMTCMHVSLCMCEIFVLGVHVHAIILVYIHMYIMLIVSTYLYMFVCTHGMYPWLYMLYTVIPNHVTHI